MVRFGLSYQRLSPEMNYQFEPGTPAYSYLRVSSAKQLQGDGVRRQDEDGQAFADFHRLNLDHTLCDLGVSAYDGSNADIGALAGFLGKVRSGAIKRGSVLIVESLDRLSRDRVLKAFRIFQDMIDAGVVIATLGDGYIYSQETIEANWTQLIISLAIMSRAHEESKRKADRLRKTWEQKRRDIGKEKLTRKCPGWLRLNADRTGFEIIDEAAKIVVRIFQECVAGIGAGVIAKRLNQEGIAPWGHSKKNHRWHAGTVERVILTNRAVLGWFQPRRLTLEEVETLRGKIKRQVRVPEGDPIPDYYPPVISDDLWLRAQRARESRKTTQGVANAGGRKGTKYSNLFSGFCRCSGCGSALKYHGRGKRDGLSGYVRCTGTGTCDNTRQYTYEPLEKAVLDWVRDLDLGLTATNEVEELERAIATATIRKGDLDLRGRSLAKDVRESGGNRYLLAELGQVQTDVEAVEAEIADLRRKLDGRKASSDPTGRAEAIQQFRESMREVQGADLYAVRAKVAQALREVVSQIEFLPDGGAVAHLKDGLGQYHFEPSWDGRCRSFVLKSVWDFSRTRTRREHRGGGTLASVPAAETV